MTEKPENNFISQVSLLHVIPHHTLCDLPIPNDSQNALDLSNGHHLSSNQIKHIEDSASSQSWLPSLLNSSYSSCVSQYPGCIQLYIHFLTCSNNNRTAACLLLLNIVKVGPLFFQPRSTMCHPQLVNLADGMYFLTANLISSRCWTSPSATINFVLCKTEGETRLGNA